jgi:cytochrome c oxidase cbb3-type subunit 3
MSAFVRVMGVLLLAVAASGVLRAGARPLPAEAVPNRTAVAFTAPGVSALEPRQQPAAPSAGNPRSIADGAKLFVAYNCVDCHGPDGSGLMGPSLADNRWRYGGSPAEVFASISGGRPEGMPVWSRWLSADQIWKLTAYVRSLGNGKDVTTLSFTDLGVKRAGH